MTSTKDLAAKWNVTSQAINRYRRKAEEEFNRSIGTPDRLDARIIIYTPEEVAIIEHFIPPKPTQVQVMTESLEPQSSLLPTTYHIERTSSHPDASVPASHCPHPAGSCSHPGKRFSSQGNDGELNDLNQSGIQNLGQSRRE